MGCRGWTARAFEKQRSAATGNLASLRLGLRVTCPVECPSRIARTRYRVGQRDQCAMRPGATEAQTFVVADGTAIPNVDLRDLLGKHQTSGACLTVVVHREARRYGSQALAVPQGIYIFDRRALDGVPAHGFCDIKEKLIPQLHSAGERVVAYETPMVTPRVLDSSTYMAVNEWMIEHLVRRGEQCEDYRRSGNASGLAHAFCPERSSKVRPRSGAAQPFARVPWSRAPRCGDGPRSARTPSPIDVSWLTTRSSSPVHTQCGRS